MKKFPVVKRKLVSSPIESSEEVSKEFRVALKKIVDFYKKNSWRHKNNYHVKASVQKQIIEISKFLKIFGKLKFTWEVEKLQDLQAYYNIDCKPKKSVIKCIRNKIRKECI